MDLCDSRNTVSILTIVYWAVLLARDTSAWWLASWLNRLIRASEELLAPAPELLKWLEWPKEMLDKPPSRLATLCSTRPSPMVLTPAVGTTYQQPHVENDNGITTPQGTAQT